MKKLMVGLCGLVFAGCVSAPFVPPTGFICHVQAPLSTEGNWDLGVKKGEASSSSILGIWASGDCSIWEAAKNGALRKVTHVDYRYDNVFGIWQKVTTIAYGE